MKIHNLLRQQFKINHKMYHIQPQEFYIQKSKEIYIFFLF